VLTVSIIGSLLGAWFVIYGIVWGFVKEDIWFVMPFTRTLSGNVDGYSAWFVGVLWILFGVYGVLCYGLVPSMLEGWDRVVRDGFLRQAQGERYYAVSVHKVTGKGMKPYHVVTITETMDRDTCMVVAEEKAGPDPIAYSKLMNSKLLTLGMYKSEWHTVSYECFGKERKDLFDPYMRKEIVSDPYVWFRDDDRNPTVIKVEGLDRESEAQEVDGIANTIILKGYEAEPILP